MEGGIALLLLVIILVVGGGIGLALYLTGGALTFRKAHKEVPTDDRPEHKEVTSPEFEHTYFGQRDDG